MTIETLDKLEAIYELIERLGLAPESRDALRKAICVRGKRRGYLLKRAPAYGTPEYSAWQAATLICNPYAASVGGSILASCMSRHYAIFHDVKECLDAASVNVQRRFSLDRESLERLGVY